MCWSLEASVLGASFSTLVSLFLIFQKEPRYNAYGYSILGITSMQWAEAFIWAFGEPGTGKTCNVYNVLGTCFLVPLAVIGQVCGPYYGFSQFYGAPKDLGPIYYILLPWFKIIQRVMSDVDCSVVTPMGYLYWGAPTTLLPLIVWWLLIILPLFLSKLDGVRFLVWSSYGLLSLLYSWAYTDSMGSNWCIYVVAYSVFALVDFYSSRN